MPARPTPITALAALATATTATLLAHFGATPTQPPPPAAAVGFGAFDMARFSDAMANGAPMVVHVPDPSRPARGPYVPSGVANLALSTAACPGVAATLDMRDQGAVVVLADGVEVGRVDAGAPDFTVEALVSRLRTGALDRARGETAARP
jgi:hypothetical protein